MPAVLAGVALGISTGLGISGAVAGATGIALGVVGGAGMFAMTMLGQKAKIPSPTSSGDIPRNSASTTYPVPIILGSTGIAGNKIRVSAPGGQTRDIILGLGQGPLNGIQRIRYNDKDFDRLGKDSTFLFKPGLPTETIPASADYPLFAEDLQCYRNTSTLFMHIAGVEYTGAGFQTLLTCEGLKCRTLADLTVREFSRNPAVIAVSFLRDIKNIQESEIDIDAFQELETYCNAYGTETSTYSEDLMGAGTIWANNYVDGGEPSQVLIDRTVDALDRFYTNTTAQGNATRQVDETWKDTNRDEDDDYWNGATITIKVRGVDYARTVTDFADGVFTLNSTVPTTYATGTYILTGAITTDITYDFGEDCSARVSRYELAVNANNTDLPKSWTFDGSNDYANWTTLQTITNHTWASSDETFDISAESIDRYRYYRLHITASSQDQIGIRRLKMFAFLGGISKRHTFDYTFDSTTTIADIEKILGSSFFGTITKSQGKYKPLYLHSQSSSFTFTPDIIQQKSVKCGVDETPNVVRIMYRDRTRDFRRDLIEIIDEVDIEERGEVIYEETCDYITDKESALRRAQFTFDCKRMLPNWVELSCGQYASAVEEYDVITVSNHPLTGSTDNKLYYVESRTDGKNGTLSFKLREYSTAIFTGRLAYSQDKKSEISGGKESSIKPSTPTTPKSKALNGGAEYSWSNPDESMITGWQVSNQITSSDGLTLSGWSNYEETQGTYYSKNLTASEILTYGKNSTIAIKIRSRNKYGNLSEPSNPTGDAIVTALGDQTTHYFLGDDSTTAYTLPSAYAAESVEIILQGLTLIKKRTGKNDGTDGSPDCWEYDESSPSSGTITLRNASQENAPYEVRYVPVA